VLDGRPGALDRAAAARLLGAEPPRPPAPPPASPPTPPVVTERTETAPPPPPTQSRWTGGVSYEIEANGRGAFQGPGASIGLRVTNGAHAATVWLQGQAYLPTVLQEGTLYSYALRVLVTVPINRWAQAGLGAGPRITAGAGGDAPRLGIGGVLENPTGNYGWRTMTTASGRLFVRGGPLTLGSFRASGSISLDVDQSVNGLWTWDRSPLWQIRPAVALELWWR
jgi:hypothetical protein